MKIAAVICEFNPFHNGHVHLLNTIKAAGDKQIVCVMSGNVTQRGKLACADKYTRAEHAVKGGADMVVELPAEFACAPAEIFALGGVKTARLCGAEELWFGSECGDMALLKEAAQLTSPHNLPYQKRVKEILEEGVSYPVAMQRAAREFADEKVAEVLASPNNMLGVEYVRAAERLGCNMQLFTIPRLCSSHQSETLEGGISSSKSIRRACAEGAIDSAAQAVPDFVFPVLSNKDTSAGFISVLKKTILTCDLKNIFDMGEGLDNKIVKLALDASSQDELALSVKSKRYTFARINRLLMNITLNNTFTSARLKECVISYINVLAIKRGSRHLLRTLARPAVTRPRDRARLNAPPCLTDNADLLFKCCGYNYDDKMRLI